MMMVDFDLFLIFVLRYFVVIECLNYSWRWGFFNIVMSFKFVFFSINNFDYLLYVKYEY